MIGRARASGILAAALLCACGDGTGLDLGGPWVQVAAGDRFSCALDKAGEAWCWGLGVFGQLGNGATAAQALPVKVSGGHAFRTLVAGNNHACGLTAAGEAWCWGYNDFGELGAHSGHCNGAAGFIRCSSVPVAVGGALAFDSIVLAAYSTCALARGGAAWCWGWNDHGQLGTGESLRVSDSLPTQVAGGRSFGAITLDVAHACAVATGGALFCWGSNDYGQLAADSVLTPRCGSSVTFLCATSPVMSTPGFVVGMVSAGGSHTCALTASGTGWCWGSNENGALGHPGAPGGVIPVSVSGGLVLAQLSAGSDHTCALDAAGAAWCWGLATWGQIGASASDVCPAFGSAQLCASAPVAVQGAGVFSAISAGTGHTCALTARGEAWCWGRGLDGQLGDGLSASSTAPVRVARP